MYICVYIPILQERGKDFTIIKGSFIGSRHDNKKSNSSAVFSNESWFLFSSFLIFVTISSVFNILLYFSFPRSALL